MNKIIFALCLLVTCSISLLAQTNIITTNALAENMMLGQFNPLTYLPSQIINDPHQVVKNINDEVSPDSLKKYIIRLGEFTNRNTGADTISSTKGIGAARRWVFGKMTEFSASNENRLKVSYLQFDQDICASKQHRNILGVLPGTDTSDKSIIIIEGHIDSRNVNLCDTAGIAMGIEDNATGTALVMELARVMSKYSYKNTIVFAVVIGEEQGLFGANAFATYALNKKIKIKGVLNNDVIGGIICGKTSSPPSCPGLNDVDSTQVRLFSFGGYNSPHKTLSRFIKLQYKEELLPIVKVPMTVSIMSAEDRTGRGGDHIPFRQKDFPAMRFTCANEHGDASNSPGYTDRQHTERDVLGVDTNADQVLDSIYVDFNYLARNAVINGAAAAILARGPQPVSATYSYNAGNKIALTITDNFNMSAYRVGVRTTTNDWDTVYTVNSKTTEIVVPEAVKYYVSVAAVDANGIESPFSGETIVNPVVGIASNKSGNKKIELMQNKPNPSDEATIISVWVNGSANYSNAFIRVTDITGREVLSLPVKLETGMNEVLYEHGYNRTGTYIYTLIVDGNVLESRRMVFTN